MIVKRLALAFILFLMTISLCLSAQEREHPVLGSLSGQVQDASGAAVAHASLELINSGGLVVATAQTNESGSYVFVAVPIGKYKLKANVTGFKTFQDSVEIGVGQTSRKDVILDIGSCTMTVTVCASLPEPVYNAVFSPTAKNDNSHLIDGQLTKLKFFIGLHDTKSALKLPLWTVNPKILEQKQNVPLTITMTCLACAVDSVQSQVMTYSNQQRRSSQAEFQFVPLRSRADAQTGASNILIDVVNGGVRYDHLVIDIFVEKVDQATQRAKNKNKIILADFPQAGPEVPEPAPDLIITVRPQTLGPLELQLDPINPELRKRFSSLYLKKGELRWFQTEDLTTDELATVEAQAALTLRGIADKKDLALQQALAQSPAGSINLDTTDYVTLSNSDREAILKSFLSIGQYFYSRLFQDAEPDLKEMIKRLEGFSFPDNHNLRILVRTNGVSFPWQLLHEPSQANEEGFWGFRYELIVDSLAKTYPGLAPSTFTPADVGTSVLGVYKAVEGESVVVSTLAHKQANYFKSKMASHDSYIADSNISFLDILKANSGQLGFVLVYTHGSSGVIVEETADGHLVVQHELQGPRLIFSQTGYVGPIDLMKLAVGTDTRKKPFLQKYPVVLLNACETGTSSISPGVGLTLPVALLHLGARGVITTESPVSDVFAYNFGNDLIDKFAEGKDIAQGLLEVRKKYSSLGNPLGLLYSFYGGSEITGSPNPRR